MEAIIKEYEDGNLNFIFDLFYMFIAIFIIFKIVLPFISDCMKRVKVRFSPATTPVPSAPPSPTVHHPGFLGDFASDSEEELESSAGAPSPLVSVSSSAGGVPAMVG